ncbi:MAG: 2TM domain-containing protein [Saprospiraceae bacterium]|nr:2TM domain-containing protein [Saprospiraceae bacterium]
MVTFSLFLINYFTTPGTWWFILPIIGWSMAVLGHYLNVFGLPSFRDEVWEEEQFEIEMDKLEKTQDLDYNENEILDISNDKFELKELKEKRKNYDSDDFV